MGKRYIDFTPILSKKALCNVVLSDRSDGKTTKMEVMSVQDFDATGKAAAYCRRFSTEITNEFFDECENNIKNAAPELLSGRDYDFIKPNNKHVGAMLLQPRDSDTKKKAISFIPVSKAGRLKSALGYETHHNIYFDEYIPLDNRYLTDEVTAILELYRTIDREHYDNRILICGNKITRSNPVFEYFNITSFTCGKVQTFQNGQFALLVYSNKANTEAAAKKPFDELVKGTKYSGYASGGWAKTFDEFILPQHSKTILLRIAHGGKVYGVYAAGDAVVIDYIKDNGQPSATVCVEQQPASVFAVWLQTQKVYKDFLQRYKYNNALFYANDIIAAALQGFYNKI